MTAGVVQQLGTGAEGGLAEMRARVDALNAASEELASDDPGRALELAEQAKRRALEADYGEGAAWSELRSADALHRLSKLEEALERALGAAGRFAEAGDESELEALLLAGRVRRELGEFAEAAAHLERALTLARAAGRGRAEADALNNLAGVLAAGGEYGRALARLGETLEVLRGLGDAEREARCLNNIGILHTKLGDYPKALERLTEADDLIRAKVRDARTEANCLINIGNVHQEMGDPANAADAFEGALSAGRRAGDRLVEAIATTNLGEARLRQGEHGTALVMFASALALSRGIGFRQGEAAAHGGLGQAHAALGQHPAALAAHAAALTLAREIGDREGEVDALLGLGRVRLAGSEFEAALGPLQAALRLAEDAERRRAVLEAHELLAAAWAARGDFASAYRHHREFHRVDKALFNEESERRARGLSARLEAERAKSEAETYRLRGEAVEQANAGLEAKVRERTAELEEARLETLTRLALAAEYRDDNTGQHTLRVGHTSAQVAKELGWPEERVELLRLAARLHDVGKIGVSDLIVLKPDKLTPAEFERMKAHTTIGAQILSGGRTPLLKMAEEIALSHHERWDGAGYPLGIEGEAIPLCGRIVAVADVYDALTSERPYKRAWSPEEAVAEIERSAGRHFDPQVVAALLRVVGQAPPAETAGEDSGAASLSALAASEAAPPPEPAPPAEALAPNRLTALIEDAWAARSVEPRRCLTLGEEALALARLTGDRRGEGYARRNLGFGCFATADYEAALAHLTSGLEIGRELLDTVLTRDCLNYLGAVHNSFGNYDAAIHHVQETLALCQGAGDRSGVASCLTNMGLLYHELGRFEDAAKHHRESVVISREIKDPAREATALTNLGIDQAALGRHGEAIETHRRALSLAVEVGNRYLEAKALLHLGEAHGHQGQGERALELVAKAQELFRAKGDREGEGQCLLAAGVALLREERPERAAGQLAAALRVAQDIRSKPLALQVHRALAQVHKALGDPATALAHFEAYHETERAVHDEAADRRARALALQREVEKTQAEAEIHRLRNVELARAVASLREADRTKSELLGALEDKSAALERQVREDPLTGLANRRHLEATLAAIFARAQFEGSLLSVVMIDVDNFKRVNDTFSHQTGDEVLRRVARLIETHVRPGDLAARYGGEEFALALPGAGAPDAAAVCERLRAAIEAHPWGDLHPELRVTASLGVCDDLAVANHEKLLGRADAKLYEAKRGGKNRVER